MEENNVVDLAGRDTIADPLTDLLKTGAQRLLFQAVEAELEDFLDQFCDQRTSDGKAAVVRNGHLPERSLQTGLGPVTVKVPKVRSRTGEPVTFRSALVPPYVRKTKTLEAALPWLYLKGISSGEMGTALKVLIGPEAEGLSASTVSRLKQAWAQEYKDWQTESLAKDKWGYIWADGISSGATSGLMASTVACVARMPSCVPWLSLASMSAGRNAFWRLKTVFGKAHRAGVRLC